MIPTASSRLPWRALYSSPPASWARLSLLTRGVGDELLRVIDRDGEIDCGREDPAVVVCRITGAHPRERRRVIEAIHELALERFLVIVEGEDGERTIRTELPDIAIAREESRRKAAKASAAHPKRARSEPEADVKPTRSEPEADPKPTRSAPEVAPKSAESLNSAPVEKSKRERRVREREEETEGTAPAAPGPSPDEIAIEGLSKRYPAELLAEVHAALRANRTTGRMAASVWRATLEKLAVFDVAVSERALRTFADRYGDGSKGEAYLVGIARNDADRPTATRAARLPTAAEYAASATSDEELEAMGLVAPRTPEERAAAQRTLDQYTKGVLHG